MNGLFHRGWWVGLAAVLAGLVAGVLLAGHERWAFQGVLRGFAAPPYFIDGQGTQASPWELRVLSAKPDIDAAKAPVVVSIGDDPERVFQTQPPSPVDYALMLQNLRRMGARKVALAAVMGWEKPDPIQLESLVMALENFDMVIQAAPLGRGLAREPMPPAFRRAALRPEVVTGDLAGLPIMNSVAVPDVIFGDKQALAGFSALDRAVTDGRVPLLARWEEDVHVVLAFPLLATLARYNLPLDGVRVRLGESIQLGPSGPVVPIDANGCLALPPKPVMARADVAAENLISGANTLAIFPADPGLIVLRDDQSTASAGTRTFSSALASAIASIESDAGLGPARIYQRLPTGWELWLVGLVASVLILMAACDGFRWWLGIGLLGFGVVAAQWVGVGLAQVWLPGFALLAAVGGGVVARMVLDNWLAADVVAEVPAVVAHPMPSVTGRRIRSVTIWREPAPSAVPSAPSEPPARPVRKTAAKRSTKTESAAPEPLPDPKPAARKTAAKKTANKRTPRSNKNGSGDESTAT